MSEAAHKYYRTYLLIAMIGYAAIKITAFICATYLILNGEQWLGALAFAGTLLIRFEFKHKDGGKKEEGGQDGHQ